MFAPSPLSSRPSRSRGDYPAADARHFNAGKTYEQRAGRQRVKKRITTIIETHQVRITRRSGKQVYAWCRPCAATVRMIRPEAFARLTKISVRTVYRRVEDGQLHFAETPDGRLFICINSLPNTIVSNTSAPALEEPLRQLLPAELPATLADDRDDSNEDR